MNRCKDHDRLYCYSVKCQQDNAGRIGMDTDGDMTIGLGNGLTIDSDGDLGIQIAPGISIDF